MLSNAELNEMTLEDLKILNQKVCETIKLKQQTLIHLKKDDLAVGMVVKYTGTPDNRIKSDETFTILSINQKKCKLKSNLTNILWTISMICLEEVK